MKTMRFISGTCIFLIFAISSVWAQTPQTVTQGSTHHYHVVDHTAAGYSYDWSIAVPAPGNTIATPNSAATNITWGTTGTYTITLTETNTLGICATPNTFQVIVIGISHLQFLTSNSAGCADQAMNLPLTFSQAADAQYYPLIVNYTVNGVARTITFAQGDPLVIPLTATDRADLAAFNPSYTIPVIITSATANGGSVVLDATTTHINTVYDIPQTNPIVAD